MLMLAFACIAMAQKPPAEAAAEKTRALQKELNLTKAQTEKVSAVYREAYEKFDKILIVAKGNREKIKTCVRPLRAVTIDKIKNILNAQQFAAYNSITCNGTYNRDTTGYK